MTKEFASIQHYPMLKDEQRIAARRLATANLLARLGGEPRFEDFEQRRISRFGERVERFALVTVCLVLIAAFVISAIHIYSTGYRAYIASHGQRLLAIVIGAAFVVLAEASILALSVIPTVWETPARVTRYMQAGIVGSAFIATIGNIDAAIFYTAGPFDWVRSWAVSLSGHPAQWAMATLPPLLTVLIGQALKYYALTRSRERHEARVAYQEAKRQWDQTVATLEKHSLWPQMWANAIWDTWCTRKRRDYLAGISVEERRLIVQREMQADQWFEEEFTGIQVNSARIQPDKTLSSKERVTRFLHEHPEIAEQLRTGDIQQAQVAAELGVSQASVSRGLAAFSANGHSVNSE